MVKGRLLSSWNDLHVHGNSTCMYLELVEAADSQLIEWTTCTGQRNLHVYVAPFWTVLRRTLRQLLVGKLSIWFYFSLHLSPSTQHHYTPLWAGAQRRHPLGYHRSLTQPNRCNLHVCTFFYFGARTIGRKRRELCHQWNITKKGNDFMTSRARCRHCNSAVSQSWKGIQTHLVCCHNLRPYITGSISLSDTEPQRNNQWSLKGMSTKKSIRWSV